MHGTRRNYRYVWDVSVPPWRALPLDRATRAPGALVGPLLPSFGDYERFLCADFLYNFSGIFGALLIVGKPEIQKQQKTGTGTEVH